MSMLGEMFSAPPLVADGEAVASSTRRVRSGSVSAVRDYSTGIERENEELRAQLGRGGAVLELDPGLVDPSPVSDRLDEADDPSFALLKASIAQGGREVPVLVRAHPSEPGRYQSAYGHRRVRACRELGIGVRALVREMGDDQLVVAQGLENAAREDLTFIERAGFALRLEQAGYGRPVIQEALAVDKAEVSKMISIGKAVPGEIIARVGRAPKVGRQRWVALGDRLKEAKALARAERAAAATGFARLPSDERFARVLAAANGGPPATRADTGGMISGSDGAIIAKVTRHGRFVRLTLDGKDTGGFAAFLVEQLPALYDRFGRTGQGVEETVGGLPAGNANQGDH